MVLAVIPARGGSKGIPRKNVRLMHGKPLIYYSIQNALACSYIDDVVVSSDDEEILSIAAMYGAKAMNRNSALAQDAVTLDPVIYDAVLRMEQETGKTYDVVVTLQATSPLLTVETLDGALKSFLESDFDTYISAVNKPHLSWTTKDGRCVPNYEKRLNRQQLPPNFLEAGAFLITRRACMSENNRIGANASVYEMPEKEAYLCSFFSCSCKAHLRPRYTNQIAKRTDRHAFFQCKPDCFVNKSDRCHTDRTARSRDQFDLRWQ